MEVVASQPSSPRPSWSEHRPLEVGTQGLAGSFVIEPAELLRHACELAGPRPTPSSLRVDRGVPVRLLLERALVCVEAFAGRFTIRHRLRPVALRAPVMGEQLSVIVEVRRAAEGSAALAVSICDPRGAVVLRVDLDVGLASGESRASELQLIAGELEERSALEWIALVPEAA
ncbi:hypothetical protein G6O69_24895 [Pseudenhygromyxa sp. WMMC2535]|uniref:hypothetical protein n=1 Tax=Pseudenhygromyxa sp. WMMC2535 TaxID=2712867 RepID=UPI001553914B|nr:hypothetical protein [Pseudenhygromyxa sp. WMMC2535]NVB41101.1 hypothetical protein [Pseudenhygromyxa sp. WMMC2535]